MLGVRVTVPVACFRKGLAREYLETEPLPPPATCYGFLLSLVGETNRQRHIGCRVAPVELAMWLDSADEAADADRLERRVRQALEHPASVNRFGGLALGESTHLVD